MLGQRPLVSAIVLSCLGSAPAFAQSSQDITTPIELITVVEIGSTGSLQRNGVLVLGEVRASHAAISDLEIKNPYRTIPAGLPLVASIVGGAPGQTDLPQDPAGVVWCDSRETGAFDLAAACLGDTNGDGKFDRIFEVPRADRRTSLGWSSIVQRKEISPAIPYRKATEAELPTKAIGYKLCDAGSLPRFAGVVRMPNGNWPSASSCTFGDRIDAQRVGVDLLVLKTSARDNAVDYTVLESPSKGPMFIDSATGPFQAAASARREIDRIVAKVSDFIQQPVIVARGPAITRPTGVLGKGDVAFSIPVRHGMTGRLLSEVKALGLLAGGAKLDSGQLVYGIPMSGSRLPSADVNYTWCAPRRKERRDGSTFWSTICLPGAATGSPYWVESPQGLLATALTYARHTSAATAPDVQREPVDLGMRLQLELVFTGWSSKSADFTLRLRSEDGPVQELQRLKAPIAGEEAVLEMPTLKTTLRFGRNADKAKAELLSLDPAPDFSDGQPVF
jgi:hypothetical protein